MIIDVHEIHDFERVESLQRYYHAFCDVDETGERYYSPDGRKCLELTPTDELRFGPSLFSARIKEMHGGNGPQKRLFEFEGRRFLSLGAFGRHFDHWSANPWSNHSRHLALFETDKKGMQFRALLFDAVTGERYSLKEGSPTILLHHMWSANDQWYLYRDVSSWHIHSSRSMKSRLVYSHKQFPKHCYFLKDEAFLLLLDDMSTLRILTTTSLEQVTQEPMSQLLNHGERIAYSFPDPLNDRFIFGINAQFGETVKCRRWLSATVAH